jgi:hypothetical protein
LAYGAFVVNVKLTQRHIKSMSWYSAWRDRLRKKVDKHEDSITN